MKIKNLTSMLIYVIGAELVGALSALFTGSFSELFMKYNPPPLMPPAPVFPVAWAILYALMGFSAYLISESPDKAASKKALTIYYAQLFLNFLWSIVFFRFEAFLAAAVILIAMLILIVIMTVKFYRIKPLAAYLNIPYIIWVTFAAYLNIATVVIN